MRRDMVFLASNSLHNLRGLKLSCPCYHARHLQQIHVSEVHEGKGPYECYLCGLSFGQSGNQFWSFKSMYTKLKVKKCRNNNYKNVIEENLAAKKETVINLKEI